MSFTLNWTDGSPGEMIAALQRYERNLQAALQDLGDALAAQLEAAAKQIAPWIDRTGAARQGLRAWAQASATGFVLTLVHSVFYGIFLELGTRNMGPRPAIMPAMEAMYGPVMAALRALVGG